MPFGIPAPVEQVVQTGSSLTIAELTARSGAKPRTVVLTGGGLPFMGAEWGSQLVMKTTWYPGNAAEATQQILVPIELPSQWEGMWRRTILSRAPAKYTDETGEQQEVIDPHLLREIIETIHRQGARLRVTWAVSGKMLIGNPKDERGTSQDVRIVREGRISQFATPIERHTDIRWRATFEWMSRGGTSDRVVRSSSDEDPGAAANALQASVLASIEAQNTTIITKRADVPLSATNLTLGKLESLADLPRKAVERYTRSLQKLVNDVKRVGDIGRKFALTPVTVQNGLLDFARNTTAVANQFVTDIDRTPPELLTNKYKTQDLLRSSRYFGNMIVAAQANAARGRDLADRIRKKQVSMPNTGVMTVRDSASSRAGDIIAIHITKDGETPQRVAQKYYGNADRSIDILRANRLPWHTPTFTRGTKLVIPVLVNKTTNV